MTQHIQESIRVTVPAGKAWTVLNDFGGIERYAPTIERSPILSEQKTGIGAKRKCEFYNDKGSIVEEIVEMQDGESLTLNLTEHGMPMKFMTAQLSVKPIDGETSELSMELDFEVKGGPFGWLLGAVMIRPVMRGAFRKVLRGWAFHAATGETVGDKLPSPADLSTLVPAQ